MDAGLLRYKYGFLEESENLQIPFIKIMSEVGPAAGLPLPYPEDCPIIQLKLSGPAAVISGAKMSYIQIEGGILVCILTDGAGVELFNRTSFIAGINKSEKIGDYYHGLMVNLSKQCFLTYVLKAEMPIFSTLPIGEEGPAYTLSPAALEPVAGEVILKKGNDPLEASNEASVLSIKEGFNYILTAGATNNGNPFVGLNAEAGFGAGVIGCGDVIYPVSASVLSINGATPNRLGNLNFNSPVKQVGGSLTIDSIPNKSELKINSQSAPCCRCTDYSEVKNYLKSYIALQSTLVREYSELCKEYNYVVGRFNSDIDCCDTAETINPRIKVWPQPNFVIQVQALAENNTKQKVCLCKGKLELTISTQSAMSATETITLPDDSTYQVDHALPAHQELMVVPLRNSSYVYFKNVNPGSNVLMTQAGNKITTSADIADLPELPGPCTEADPPNTCMEPCTGYFMLTGGLNVIDPIFRKIVHINATPVTVNILVKFSFTGKGANPCGNCGSSQTLAEGYTTAILTPNIRSSNPCANIVAQSILQRVDSTGIYKYYLKFPDAVWTTNTAKVTVAVRYFDVATALWDTAGTIELSYLSQNWPDGEVLLRNGNEPIDPYDQNLFPIDSSIEVAGLIITATSILGNFTSRCYPDPTDPAAFTELPIGDFSLGLNI